MNTRRIHLCNAHNITDEREKNQVPARQPERTRSPVGLLHFQPLQFLPENPAMIAVETAHAGSRPPAEMFKHEGHVPLPRGRNHQHRGAAKCVSVPPMETFTKAAERGVASLR